MRKIYVDIYNQYWDIEEMKPVENLLISSKDYNSFVYSCFLEEALHYVLSDVKGDGYFIKIERTLNEEYINIFLVATKEEVINVDYIHEFFENLSTDLEAPLQEKLESDIKDSPNFETSEKSHSITPKDKIYISLEYFEEEEVEEIVRMFNEKNYDTHLVSNETVIYERGASSIYFNFILEVSTLIGGLSGAIALVQVLKDKSKKQYRNVSAGQIDWEGIKEQVSQFTGINTLDLRGVKFEITDFGIEVLLSSRYKEIQAICDSNFKVIKVDTVNKSQTVI